MQQSSHYKYQGDHMFKYEKFIIERYKAISSPITINVSNSGVYPIIGINECGKTTILQAILAFSNYNDKLNAKYNHLENFRNLYTNIKESSVSAIITGSKLDLKNLLEEFREKTDSNDWDAYNVAYGALDNEIRLEITRKFNVNENGSNSITYSFFIFDEQGNKHNFFTKQNIQHEIATKVLKSLPFIFYFDDFRDTFSGKIELTKVTKRIEGEPQTVTYNIESDDMAATLERIFIESYKDEPNEARETSASLFGMNSTELATTTSKLNKKINELINDKWSVMQSLSKEEKPTVKLSINKGDTVRNTKAGTETENITAEFLVQEEKNGEEKYFSIQDRSKGFLWFFTFILKTEFNPNRDITKANSIYLLDEPGCYLHSSAQKGLCEVLENLSKNSVVIYNTHSHFLLSNSFLPNVKIAFKDEMKNIKLIHFSQYNNAGENKSKLINPDALEPIRSALKVSPSLLETQYLKKNILIVEGLTDFYSWSLFVDDNKSNNIGIIPSTGADHTIYLLSLLLASDKNPMCLLDNDDKGREIATKNQDYNHFFKTLNGYNDTIESLYDKDELAKIATMLNISDYSSSVNQQKYLIPIIYKTAKFSTDFINTHLPKTKKSFNDYWRKNIANLWND